VSTGHAGDVFLGPCGRVLCDVEGLTACKSTSETPLDAADPRRSLWNRHGDDTLRERGDEVMVPAWAENVRGTVDLGWLGACSAARGARKTRRAVRWSGMDFLRDRLPM
jgi:hypothetical protein